MSGRGSERAMWSGGVRTGLTDKVYVSRAAT